MIVLLSIGYTTIDASAATSFPDGFLIGDDNGLKVTKDGDYFFNLTGLQPGDTITRNLVIQNNRKNDAFNLKMIIEPRSRSGKIDLVKEMKMIITIDGNELYNGTLASDTNGNQVSSRELDLGSFAANSKTNMQIQLNLSSNISYKDFYSGKSTADVVWTFAANAEKSAIKPPGKEDPDGELPPTSKPGNGITSLLPQTGDSLPIFLYKLSGILLVITALLYLYLKRKEQKIKN